MPSTSRISTRVLLDLLGWEGQVLTSSCLSARPGRAVRLAGLSAMTGARAYLRGAGGMTCLDPAPFMVQNIAVASFRPPTTGIWSSGRRLSALWALATLGSGRRGSPPPGSRRPPRPAPDGSCPLLMEGDVPPNVALARFP